MKTAKHPRYTRILLKLSGEALGGPTGLNICPKAVAGMAEQLREVRELGVQVVVVVGGGNIFRGLSVSYEGESALVIGKRARRVTDGSKHIFGYTCFNDVTARDLQKTDVDWTRAKGFDTFAPIGPFISTKCPSTVETRLNGKVVQNSPLSDRVFDDAALVEYISGIMTLEPGDIIATGTPSGIAPLKRGDVVEVELDTVGTLTNQVVKSP